MNGVALTIMVAALVFHYTSCLIPVLRHFRARALAYIAGAAAYAAVGLPPVLDSMSGTTITQGAPYWVWTVAVLTVMAWRPYVFVRVSGGSRRPTRDAVNASHEPAVR